MGPHCGIFGASFALVRYSSPPKPFSCFLTVQFQVKTLRQAIIFVKRGSSSITVRLPSHSPHFVRTSHQCIFHHLCKTAFGPPLNYFNTKTPGCSFSLPSIGFLRSSCISAIRLQHFFVNLIPFLALIFGENNLSILYSIIPSPPHLY